MQILTLYQFQNYHQQYNNMEVKEIKNGTVQGEYAIYENDTIVFVGTEEICNKKLEELQPQTTVSKILNIFK